jgi:hypothetical protein
MADADAAVSVLPFQEALQVGHLALALENVHAAVGVQGGYAGAVITSVFQSVKTLDDDGTCLSLSHVSYNTAHNSLPPISKAVRGI